MISSRSFRRHTVLSIGLDHLHGTTDTMPHLSRKLRAASPVASCLLRSSLCVRPRCQTSSEQPPEWLSRSHLIMGTDALQTLKSASITVVGLGGVGSWCAEMLVRSGVGNLILVDGDVIDSSNRNRQLPALSSTLGQRKVDVMQDRLRDINPGVNLTPHHMFLEPDTAREVAQRRCSYIIDCIDSIAPKVELIYAAMECDQPIISSMGAGGKTSPSMVMVTDVSNTHHDAFARVVRTRLRKRGVTSGLQVVFSPEPPVPNSVANTEQRYKRSYYGTMSYMPAVFGMHAASAVIQNITVTAKAGDPRVLSKPPCCNRDIGATLPQGYMYNI
eukprot:jgi/Ulvmu1/3199/UM015_0240.1